MRQFIVITLLLTASVTLARKPGFTVKFGVLGISGRSYHYDIPRELSSLEDTWSKVERPADDVMPSLDMYCMNNDYTFCAYYDSLGYVAGCQIALSTENLTQTVPTNLSDVGFKTWTPSGSSNSYYTHKQFFVSEATLALTEKERLSQHADNLTLYDGGVWITDYNHELYFLSSKGADIENSEFTKQACIPGMGQHYYYNMSSEANAYKMFPWFPLVNDGNLVGTGFLVLGKWITATGAQRDWFEHPSRTAVETIVPRGPTKLYELSADPGVVTMHIYYVKHPTFIDCTSEYLSGLFSG